MKSNINDKDKTEQLPRIYKFAGDTYLRDGKVHFALKPLLDMTILEIVTSLTENAPMVHSIAKKKAPKDFSKKEKPNWEACWKAVESLSKEGYPPIAAELFSKWTSNPDEMTFPWITSEGDGLIQISDLDCINAQDFRSKARGLWKLRRLLIATQLVYSAMPALDPEQPMLTTQESANPSETPVDVPISEIIGLPSARDDRIDKLNKLFDKARIGSGGLEKEPIDALYQQISELSIVGDLIPAGITHENVEKFFSFNDRRDTEIDISLVWNEESVSYVPMLVIYHEFHENDESSFRLPLELVGRLKLTKGDKTALIRLMLREYHVKIMDLVNKCIFKPIDY